MSLINSESGNTFAVLKVDTRLDYLFDKKNYNLSNIKFLEKLKCFGSTIDTVSKFSHQGLYYNNSLIFAIDNKNLDLVKMLLENGSASRGYSQFPGYPLYSAILNTEEESIKKNKKNVIIMISIIKLLVKYGARFDDYVVLIFWFKYDLMFESLESKDKSTIKELYLKSPFNYYKYETYLNVYCHNFISNQKNKMLECFLKKHPIKRNKSFILVNLFSFK
tara:strand:+ start:443 stop:1102 length:660 start_codon:yes stop_codon:yes gene_type:complete